MNFRKGILALAAVGFGLTGIASAQITCSGGSATPTFMRAEGTTELAPVITIGGSGGCTLGATNPGTISVVLTTSAGVSNQATSSTTTNTDATASFDGDTSVAGVVVGSTLVFNNIPVPASLTGTANLLISNVRVNASSVPPNTNVTASVSGTSGVILSNASGITVGYTQAGVAKPLVEGYTNTPICSASSIAVPLVQAEIVSGFPGSFAPEGSATQIYVAVTFGNLVNGVNYYVPVTLSAGTNSSNVTANLVSGNSSTTTLTGVAIPSTTNTEFSGVAQLTVTNGSATATYLLSSATPSVTEAFLTTLYAVTTSSASAGASGPVMVSAALLGNSMGTYDQFSTTYTATTVSAVNNATGSPIGFGGSVTIPGTSPAVTLTQTGTNDFGELSSCATTLLFPYILNTGGYDTGIALTNASAGSAVAQSGTCTMTFYGSGAPSSAYTTPSVASGTVDTFTVSSVAAGFQGYAIAACNFQNAHGFAFITDGYGQPGRGLSQGYLAIVTAANGFTNSNSGF